MIRTLLFSTLYPSTVFPGHGIFVETRLRQLLASGSMEARVVAPVPWFPLRHSIFGEYALMAKVPAHETRDGVQVEHPSYLVIPKLGTSVTPFTLAHVGLKACRRLIRSGFDFDLIDAHYFFPDGAAATMIGEALKKPVVITARGSDVNVLPKYAAPRRMILGAARKCAAIITVSRALKDALVRLGVESERIQVLRNGVDTTMFYQEERAAARESLGIAKFALASVGNLIPTKGHHQVVQAVARMPGVELLIAGRGEEEPKLKALAAALGVSDRVRLLGALPQSRLRTLYSAVDCLVLASEREGWPNVVLEAMACGTPVVASRVGGVPEILTEPNVGVMLDQVNPEAIVCAVNKIGGSQANRDDVRAYARQFSWEDTTSGQLALYQRVVAASRGLARA